MSHELEYLSNLESSSNFAPNSNKTLNYHLIWGWGLVEGYRKVDIRQSRCESKISKNS